MAEKKVKPIDRSKKMKVKTPFKHGAKLYAKDEIVSFSQGALEKYASNLEEVKAVEKK